MKNKKAEYRKKLKKKFDYCNYGNIGYKCGSRGLYDNSLPNIEAIGISQVNCSKNVTGKWIDIRDVIPWSSSNG